MKPTMKRRLYRSLTITPEGRRVLQGEHSAILTFPRRKRQPARHHPVTRPGVCRPSIAGSGYGGSPIQGGRLRPPSRIAGSGGCLNERTSPRSNTTIY